MAAFAFNLLWLLQFVTANRAKIKQAWALLMALYELFAGEIEAGLTPDDGLEFTAPPTIEEQALLQIVTDELSADGTQAAIDLGRMRKLAKFLNEARNSELGKFLIAIFTSLSSGS